MRYFEELSFKEIAERTEVSINTALGRMRYALMNMRRMATEKNIYLEIKQFGLVLRSKYLVQSKEFFKNIFKVKYTILKMHAFDNKTNFKACL